MPHQHSWLTYYRYSEIMCTFCTDDLRYYVQYYMINYAFYSSVFLVLD